MLAKDSSSNLDLGSVLNSHLGPESTPDLRFDPDYLDETPNNVCFMYLMSLKKIMYNNHYFKK